MSAPQGSKRTSDFPVVGAPFNSNDRVVLIYGASTANTSNCVAQTATITLTNLFNSTPGTIAILPLDPANSTAVTCVAGAMWVSPASNTLYVSPANNTVLKVQLTAF